jgi:hypothetical protein
MIFSAEGNPVIATKEDQGDDLVVVACADATCSSSSLTVLDSTSDVGDYISIALGADGNPVIAYYDATTEDLKVAACSNATCTSATITYVDIGHPDISTGQFNSIAIGSDDNPVISYHGGGGSSGLKFAVCSNPTCTSSTVTTLDAGSGWESSIAIGADGNPVISHAMGIGASDADHADNTLLVTTCSDASCTSTTEASQGVLVANEYFERGTQIAIGSDGLPVIVFTSSDHYVSVAECTVADCSSGTEIRAIALADIDASVSLAIRDSDQARLISYYAASNVYVAVLEAP